MNDQPLTIYQQQQILHTCANKSCGRTYYGHPRKVYCTTRCRATVARHRVQEREREMFHATSTTMPTPDPRCIGTQENPTMEWLQAAAKSMPQGKFYILHGIVPVGAGTEISDGAIVCQSVAGVWQLLK